jgi:hypothetical protein
MPNLNQYSLHRFFFSAFSLRPRDRSLACPVVSQLQYSFPRTSFCPSGFQQWRRTIIGVLAKCCSIASIRCSNCAKISSCSEFKSFSERESISEGAQTLIAPSSVILSESKVCGRGTGMGEGRWLCGMNVAAVSSLRCGRTWEEGGEESSTVWKEGGAVVGRPVK